MADIDLELERLRQELTAADFWARHYHQGKANGTIIEVDYPVHPKARDFSSSPHMKRLMEQIHARRDGFRDLLSGIAERHVDKLRQVPVDAPADVSQPHWTNGWLPGLDAVSIYAFIADRKPKTYFEVGSGNSTKFARKAIVDYKLSTRIVSVDPHPRTEVDSLCDELHRTGFENFDLSLMEQLEAGDVVFIDNSHRALPNSDVTVFFMEALGRIPSGCLYGLHDIFLPNDYSDEWCKFHFFTEQYLLGAYLFGGADGDEIVMPCGYISTEPDLISILDSLWIAKPGILKHGGAFWLKKS